MKTLQSAIQMLVEHLDVVLSHYFCITHLNNETRYSFAVDGMKNNTANLAIDAAALQRWSSILADAL
jgi:hypothetical protein